MLTWVASVFSGRALTRRHLHQRGDLSVPGLAVLVKQLILIRACELVRLNRARPAFFQRGRDLRPRHIMRSIIGSKLRRALDHRDPLKRIAILIGALTHLDAWSARFAKRLYRGLRRLWAIAPAPTSALLILGPPAPPPACADSS
jgi:hypothetical protein